MSNIIDQIESVSFGKIQLFFDEHRLGEEVRLNLASFHDNGTNYTSKEINLLVHVLQKAIHRMEIAVGAILNQRMAIFYMWHDRYANLLRWSVISDFGQNKLPLCSNVHKVDIMTVVKEWTAPIEDLGLLSMNEIEQMTAAELRNLSRNEELPAINAYVRRVPNTEVE